MHSPTIKMDRVNVDNWLMQGKIKSAISNSKMADRRGRRPQRSGPMIVKPLHIHAPETNSAGSEFKKIQPNKLDTNHCETRMPKAFNSTTTVKMSISAPTTTPNLALPPSIVNLSSELFSAKALHNRQALSSTKPLKPLLLPKVSSLELPIEKQQPPLNKKCSQPGNNETFATNSNLFNSSNGGHKRKNGLRRPVSMLVLPTHASRATTTHTRSRPPSPSYCSPSGRRTPSPGSALDPATVEIVRKRVRNVQRARLYLLQQPGPHSFLIVADSPEHKYKVIIGPQSCTCGKGPHCIHILFVMLRVFQSRETDPKLFAKTLKNFEVEELIKQFEARRKKQARSTTPFPNCRSTNNAAAAYNSFCQNPMKSNLQTSRSEPSLPEVLSARQNAEQNKSVKSSREDESALCPICLLEMVEGESLVKCEHGCRNKLHQHCISIWADECLRQSERILCPLCRAQWPQTQQQSHTSKEESSPHHHSPHHLHHHQQHLNRNLSSPNCIPSKSPSLLPSSSSKAANNQIVPPWSSSSSSTPASTRHPSSPCATGALSSSSSSSSSSTLKSFVLSSKTTSQFPEVQSWLSVFGSKFVSSLLSHHWSHRENALKWLARQVVSILSVSKKIPEDNLGKCDLGNVQRLKDCRTVFEACCGVVASMITDPVYKVYVAALRCFRAILTYSPIRSDFDLQKLQLRVKPIIKAILLKCADGNRRTTQLSIATLIEISNGQSSAMAVGQHTEHPALNGLDGVEFILNCALEEEEEEIESPKVAKHWKWLLGRLAVAERLLEEFPQEFSLLYVHYFSPGKQTTVDANDESNDESHFKQQQLNHRRLISLLEFAKKSLEHPHSTVNKVASRVFIMASRFTSCIPPVFSQVFDMIADIDCNIQSALYKKLEAIIEELHLPANGNSPANRDHKTGNNLFGSPQAERAQEKKLVKEKLISDDEESALRRSSFERFSGHSLSLSFENNSPTTKKIRPSFLPLNQPIRPARPKTFVSKENAFKNSAGKKLTSPSSSSASKRNTLIGKCKSFKSREDKEDLFDVETPSLDSPSLEENDSLIDLSPSERLTTPSACSSGIFSPTLSFCSELETPVTPSSSCNVNWKLSVTRTLASPKTPDSLCIESYDAFPIIPGLRDSPDNELVISLQPDLAEIRQDLVLKGDQECFDRGGGGGSYTENVHWRKGPLIGTGAFSSCYQARDKKTGVLMAVKQLSFYRNNEVEQEKVMEAIRDEIVMMSKLHHPNIIRLLGATQQGGHYNVFEEWMAGGSVASLLDRYGPFNEQVILRYTWQVLDGLSYLHNNQILHRDLKGANLLVDSNGHHLRIADFGAAARLRSQSTVTGEFQGQLLGTIAFMAPEVLRGEDYGRSCDVWSVGCILIEMATAKPPWNANDVSNHLALIFKIACSNAPPVVPDYLSQLTRDLTLQCLQLKSEDRPHAKDLLNHSSFHQNLAKPLISIERQNKI